MSLTPGFKKFIGLIATTAIVAGSIYAYKSGMFKSEYQSVIQNGSVQTEPIIIPSHTEVVKPQVALAPAQVRNESIEKQSVSQPTDASSDRGMAALLGIAK